MKALKKIGSLLLVVLLIASMATVAFADDDVPALAGSAVVDLPSYFTITVNSNVSGHTYEAYQIFAGTVMEENGENYLGNVTWGSGIDASKLDSEGKLGGKTAAEWAKYLEEKGVDAAEEFADLVGAALSNVKVELTEGEGFYSASVPSSEAGYYLIKDADGSVTGNDAYTDFILEVVGDAEATPKSDVPSFDKQVEDKNDSEADEPTWGETADHDIGDNVNYKLTGTLPSDYANYKQYYYKFTDVMSAGLTYNADAKVYAVKGDQKVDITNHATITPTEETAGATLVVEIEDLKDITEVELDSTWTIVVEYSAELNEDANIGAEGNENTAHLTFSNNPNQEKSGTPDTGDTPDDTVIVFTFELDVNKVDEEIQPLAGAEFTLEKWNEAEQKWEPVQVIKSADGTKFTSTGLDDGKYKLTETKTPAGYNTIDPIEFEVVAYHTQEEGQEELTRLEIRDAEGNVISVWTALDNDFNVLPEDSSFSITQEKISTNVVNNKGVNLPSTGGIGTTIFYIVGGLLVVGTGVLLIVKRRMHNEG